MAQRPDFLSFDGPDGPIAALRWPGLPGAPTVVAIHGITANAWHFDPVAHRLAGAVDLVAVDLRGRGRSVDHPGPFGIRCHADDIAAVIREIGRPAVLVGHSMGGSVALMTADRHPDLVDDVILVDGGTALSVPDGTSVDEALDASLGPAIERLRKVWADRVSYHTMWSQHPAFVDGISIDLERDLLSDLVAVDGGFRTAVDEAAVRTDGRELLADDEVRSLLERRTRRTTIIHAPAGLDGSPPPLIDDSTIAALPDHEWISAPGTNHYTVLLGPIGANLVSRTIRASIGLYA